MSVYLCVSIDCECDKGAGWRTQKPLAFSATTVGIGERLQPLFRRFRAKPTYLLSPELMRDARSLEVLAKLQGDAELGTHLHGEFAEPGAFEPDVTSAFQCHYDRDTERQKLTSLTELFQSSFGRRPQSFRAGRFGIGRHSLRLLQDLGYSVDSSVTPHKTWARAGAPEASFLKAQTQPYWPDLERPERVASVPGTLMEVPVTIRPTWLGRILGRWIEPAWLRPTHRSTYRLVHLAEEEIRQAYLDGRPVILNAMFHNVEIVPGASPYAATPAEADAIMARLAGLLAWAERREVRCIGLADVPELFAR